MFQQSPYDIEVSTPRTPLEDMRSGVVPCGPSSDNDTRVPLAHPIPCISHRGIIRSFSVMHFFARIRIMIITRLNLHVPIRLKTFNFRFPLFMNLQA